MIICGRACAAAAAWGAFDTAPRAQDGMDKVWDAGVVARAVDTVAMSCGARTVGRRGTAGARVRAS